MKLKYITGIPITFILLFLLLSIIPISAEERYDSVYFEPQEISDLGFSSDDMVLRVYPNGGILWFSRYLFKDLDGVVRIAEYGVPDNGFFYIAYHEDGTRDCIAKSDDGIMNTTMSDYNNSLDFYANALTPEKFFDSSVEIKNIYCFATDTYSPPYWDKIICFSTNVGEYVLYSSSEYTALFMSLSEFCEFATVLFDKRGYEIIDLSTMPDFFDETTSRINTEAEGSTVLTEEIRTEEEKETPEAPSFSELSIAEQPTEPEEETSVGPGENEPPVSVFVLIGVIVVALGSIVAIMVVSRKKA